MSGAAFDFTEEQRANYRLDCAEKAAAAARRAAMREARQARGGAMSNAERQRAFVARANDLREIPAPADPEGREACRRDFLRFVHRYGAALLKDHAPAPLMCEKFLKPLQQSVLDGGQILVEMPRGKGKTTFIDLCAAWAIAYGLRRFVVLISATGKLAKVNLKNIMRVFLSPAFAADFPEISAPFLALDGKWQLCETQTYRGEKTGIELKTDRIVFPTVRGEDGAPLGDAGGAILFSGGVGGAIRGLNEGGVRPDMVFFDDIQKRKDAKSPALSAGLEEFVNQDAMGLFGHGAPKTALMAITPICDGDFASLMTDRERNPAWITVIVPLVLEWPTDRELVDRFFALYKDDCARDDFARTQSRAFFAANREALWKGCVLLDPMDGGADEIDALHHVLVLVASVGQEAFDAEYQMRVREEGAALTVTPDAVKHAVNGVPEYTLPPGTESVCGFCDVNAQAASGLRYVLVAFGAGRVCGVVTYGKYPAGRVSLFPDDLPEAKKPAVIAAAVKHVGRMVAALPLKFPNGKTARVVSFAFDGGNWTSAVARAVLHLRTVDRVPFQVFWTLGRGWSKFSDVRREKRHMSGDHMFATQSRNGSHVVFHADYWREIAQSLWLSEPLTPGSCSLFGADPFRHDEFAQEVCAERLVRKFVRPDGRLEWDWSLKSKMNHYGDAYSGAFVVGSWVRAFESDERLIDRAAVAAKFRRVAAAPAAPGADRAAMERELAAAVEAGTTSNAVAAAPEAASGGAPCPVPEAPCPVPEAPASGFGTVTYRPAAALARKRKRKFHFSHRLKK